MPAETQRLDLWCWLLDMLLVIGLGKVWESRSFGGPGAGGVLKVFIVVSLSDSPTSPQA